MAEESGRTQGAERAPTEAAESPKAGDECEWPPYDWYVRDVNAPLGRVCLAPACPRRFGCISNIVDGEKAKAAAKRLSCLLAIYNEINACHNCR